MARYTYSRRGNSGDRVPHQPDSDTLTQAILAAFPDLRFTIRCDGDWLHVDTERALDDPGEVGSLNSAVNSYRAAN